MIVVDETRKSINDLNEIVGHTVSSVTEYEDDLELIIEFEGGISLTVSVWALFAEDAGLDWDLREGKKE